MLMCEHRAERLAFWIEALSYLLPETWVTDQSGTRHHCKSAVLDVGLDMPDPGMVPDGAVCGDDKVSFHNRLNLSLSLSLSSLSLSLSCFYPNEEGEDFAPQWKCEREYVATEMSAVLCWCLAAVCQPEVPGRLGLGQGVVPALPRSRGVQRAGSVSLRRGIRAAQL